MKNRTDITIYLKRYNEEKRDDDWHCFQLFGTHWFNGQRSTLTGSKYNKTVVRILERTLFDTFALKGDAYALLLDENGNLFVQEGDIVLRGIYTDKLPSEALSKASDSFTVQTVTDNRKGSANIRHYRIGGV